MVRLVKKDHLSKGELRAYNAVINNWNQMTKLTVNKLSGDDFLIENSFVFVKNIKTNRVIPSQPNFIWHQSHSKIIVSFLLDNNEHIVIFYKLYQQHINQLNTNHKIKSLPHYKIWKYDIYQKINPSVRILISSAIWCEKGRKIPVDQEWLMSLFKNDDVGDNF